VAPGRRPWAHPAQSTSTTTVARPTTAPECRTAVYSPELRRSVERVERVVERRSTSRTSVTRCMRSTPRSCSSRAVRSCFYEVTRRPRGANRDLIATRSRGNVGRGCRGPPGYCRARDARRAPDRRHHPGRGAQRGVGGPCLLRRVRPADDTGRATSSGSAASRTRSPSTPRRCSTARARARSRSRRGSE